jgi:hypothetical protein
MPPADEAIFIALRQWGIDTMAITQQLGIPVTFLVPPRGAHDDG